MAKTYKDIFKNDNMRLTEEKIEYQLNGSNCVKISYWLWDEIEQVNRATNAKTVEEAYIQAIKSLQGSVSFFKRRCIGAEVKLEDIEKILSRDS